MFKWLGGTDEAARDDSEGEGEGPLEEPSSVDVGILALNTTITNALSYMTSAPPWPLAPLLVTLWVLVYLNCPTIQNLLHYMINLG